MTISFTRYIDIVSGVGAGTVVNRRELIGRIFSTNGLIPTKTLIEFTTLKDIATYFGTDSTEYKRASFYFSWVSKNITSPNKLGFYRWTDANIAPVIFGGRLTTTLTEMKDIEDGAFTLTMGAITHTLTAIDFSGAASLAAVAAILQTKIRAADANNQWDQSTVTYDATRGAFNFQGGLPEAAAISTALAGSGTEILHVINWAASDGAILSDGALAETITEVLTESADASDNFGSFLFIPALDDDEIVEAAEWNDAQNVKFIYLPRVLAADSETLSAALENIGGVGVTLAPLSDEYPEQLPMNILAATDYNRRNSAQNYMFQKADLTASVTTDANADIYDGLRINYYGVTQTAGQYLAFYQRGVLMGLDTDPRDMNTYANEIWLKDAIGAALMELLLALPEVPANQKGQGEILAVLQTIINQALFNGVISIGKPLTQTQKAYILEITGDERAWFQVQNAGYWVYVVMVPEQNKATYTLVYSKDDVIRKIEGSDILI